MPSIFPPSVSPSFYLIINPCTKQTKNTLSHLKTRCASTTKTTNKGPICLLKELILILMKCFYWNKANLKSNGSHFCFTMLILVHCICCLIQKQASWLMAVSMSMSACSISLMLIPLQPPSKRRSSHVIETTNHKGKTLLSQHTFPIIL